MQALILYRDQLTFKQHGALFVNIRHFCVMLLKDVTNFNQTQKSYFDVQLEPFLLHFLILLRKQKRKGITKQTHCLSPPMSSVGILLYN